MTPKCPRCGQVANAVVRCDKCGDARCNSALAKKGCSSLGEGGNHGHPCKECKKGKYKRI